MLRLLMPASTKPAVRASSFLFAFIGVSRRKKMSKLTGREKTYQTLTQIMAQVSVASPLGGLNRGKN
jgi:hypothetical protein